MTVSETAAAVADAMHRRSNVYIEIADNDPSLGAHTHHPSSFVAPRREQGFASGTIGDTQLKQACAIRLGNMDTVVAVASSDGERIDAPNIVSVRRQAGSESFDFPSVAFTTDAVIRAITLASACVPMFNCNNGLIDEGTLMLAVQYGDDLDATSIALLVSQDKGRSWVIVWGDNSGDMTQPKLVVNLFGDVFLFYVDRTSGDLNFYAQKDVTPGHWEAGSFSWSSGPSTSMNTLQGGLQGVVDIACDKEVWVFTSCTLNDLESGIQVFGYSPMVINTDPTDWTFSDPIDASCPDGVMWAAVGRTGGHDEFGSFPPGAVLGIYACGDGTINYSILDLDPDTGFTARKEEAYGLYSSTGAWQDINAGFYYTFDQPAHAEDTITNKEVWNYRTTPSTSITYDNSDDLGDYVAIDNHGPTDDDDDSSDNFASFVTKSTIRHSVAFPPFDPTKDLEVYFNFQFFNLRYHNIWFVIDDPRHTDTPIFKADFYIGYDTDPADTHPHDNARGLAMWFCKPSLLKHPIKTSADAPRGSFIEQYRHPIEQMFSGYDDTDDNLRVWKMKLVYNHTDDVFELYWAPDPDNPFDYVPFVPYLGHSLGDREYVDIGPDGTDDVYVASTDDVYWKQPRNGRWPWRFYVGCPEVKPAFERQSGIKVGALQVAWSDNSDNEQPINAPYRGCIIPRMSGGLDVWYVEEDVLYRQTCGHGWQDVKTWTNFHSSHRVNGGPDQAEITLLNVDNYETAALFKSLRDYNAFVWARSGRRYLGGDYSDSGDWAEWRSLFFGRSDTGEPVEDDSGPNITMSLFSPLRDMTRSHQTQGFSTLSPPEKKDPDTGEGTGEPDPKAAREWNILYMTDFDRPADETLPVDSKGRLMRFDDYITRYAWEDMLALPPDKLDVDRMGFQPATLTINSGSGEADLLDSLRTFWTQIGLWWWFDYDAGGIFRLSSPTTIDREGDPDITLHLRPQFTLPVQGSDTDWGKAGNVRISATNLESRPNTVVARVAPWPDGADETEESAEWANGLPSQFAIALLYQARTPYRALDDLWDGAKPTTFTSHAFPYFWPTQRIVVEAEVDLPAVLLAGYSKLANKYIVLAVEHQATPDSFTTQVTMVEARPFGTW